MDEHVEKDLHLLKRSVQRLLTAASVESRALENAQRDCNDQTIGLLHQAHLDELDAMQALATCMHLLERRPGPISSALKEVP